LPEAAGLYLVAWQIDAMTSEIAEDALRHLQEQMDAVLKAHDLNEEDIWGSGAAPPEYEELRQQYMDAWDELYAQKLRNYGEPAMADLFRSDPTTTCTTTWSIAHRHRLLQFDSPRLVNFVPCTVSSLWINRRPIAARQRQAN